MGKDRSLAGQVGASRERIDFTCLLFLPSLVVPVEINRLENSDSLLESSTRVTAIEYDAIGRFWCYRTTHLALLFVESARLTLNAQLTNFELLKQMMVTSRLPTSAWAD
jgi:hypothetical protein